MHREEALDLFGVTTLMFTTSPPSISAQDCMK
jgi:hypothetical protein